tara:strand:- start:1253 stop:1624 length:372 start_codon:yes stop_codon:yes gene_type:complete
MILNRKIVKDLRETLQSNLLKNMDEFEISVGNASFSDTEVTYKLNVRLKGAESREERDLRVFGEMDGVDTTKIADVQGIKYSLIGYNRKGRIRPYIVKNLDTNKDYLFTTDMAKKFFSKGEVA